jgi:hypothetical protein
MQPEPGTYILNRFSDIRLDINIDGAEYKEGDTTFSF